MGPRCRRAVSRQVPRNAGYAGRRIGRVGCKDAGIRTDSEPRIGHGGSEGNISPTGNAGLIECLGKALPRDWIVSGKEIQIAQAPTRWGRVDYKVQMVREGQVTATVKLLGDRGPKELHVKFRLPSPKKLQTITANGSAVKIGGLHGDTAVIETGGHSQFEVVAHFS